MKWDWRQFIGQYIDKLVHKLDLQPEDVEVALQEINQFGAAANDYLQELRNLQRPQTIDMLCQFALDSRYPVARQIALDAGYAPRGLHRRAIFFYLTGQWPKYEELDPSRELLSKAYQLATPEERRKIAEAGRKAGRTEIVGIVARQHGTRSLPEAAADFTKLIAAQRWAELWAAALVVAPLHSARLLRQLHAVGWQPTVPEERILFEQLRRLSATCSETFIPETTLQPAAKFWIAEIGTRSAELKLSPDGSVVVIAKNLPLQGQVLEEYRVADGRRLASFQSDAASRYVFSYTRPTFSPDGRYLAFLHTAIRGQAVEFLLEVVSVPEMHSLVKIPGYLGKDWSSGAAFTFLGSDQLAVWSPTAYPRQIVVYSLPGGTVLTQLDWPTNTRAELHQLLASANGQLLAGRDARGGYWFWSVSDQELLQDLSPPNLGESPTTLWFAASPASNPLLIYSNFSHLELRNVLTGRTLATFNMSYGRLPNAVALRQDGRLLLAAYPDHSVRLWQVPSGVLIRNLKRHGDEVVDVTFISDGKFVSVSKNGLVRLWVSKLYELCEKPTSLTPIADWLRLERLAKNPVLSREERAWAYFAQALLGWKFRHEVEIGEISTLQAAALDIELDFEPED